MKITIIPPHPTPSTLPLPLLSSGVAAGFPSPADDYIDCPLDLNEHLIKRPAATYYARANGDSLNGLGIHDKDLLVIDRSLSPQHGDVVIAAIDGELCCKILDLHNRQLCSANPAFPPVILPEEADLIIEGVVIHAVHHMRRN